MSAFVALALAAQGCLAPIVNKRQIEHGKAETLFVQARVPGGAVDRWTGADKAQHFGMSFATTVFSYAAATAAGTAVDGRVTVALSAGAIAGLGKEIVDVKRGRIFSVRDLVADALGIGAAWLLVREVR